MAVKLEWAPSTDIEVAVKQNRKAVSVYYNGINVFDICEDGTIYRFRFHMWEEDIKALRGAGVAVDSIGASYVVDVI